MALTIIWHLAFAALLTIPTCNCVTSLVFAQKYFEFVVDHLNLRFYGKIRIITCMWLAAQRWR